MPEIIDGRLIATIMKAALRPLISAYILHSRLFGEGVPPTLAVLCYGDSPTSKKYVEKKLGAGTALGMRILPFWYDNDTHIDEPIDTINWLNSFPEVHGIMVQHPIPTRYLEREQELFDYIKPEKDVDGLTSTSQGHLFTGRPGFQSSTAKAIMKLLDTHISLYGKWVTIVGASNIIGKPLSMLLTNAGASVALFQKSSREENAMLSCQYSDVIISCCGVPHLIDPEYLREGVTLIDAGCSIVDGKSVGDINPECYEFSKFYTPHIGGVGPVTIATLLTQTVEAALGRMDL